MWNKLSDDNSDNQFSIVWGNKKVRSIIYLLLWIIALWVVYIIYIKPLENDHVAQSNNETIIIKQEDDTSLVTFDTMKQNLLNKNFSYVFKFNDDMEYKGNLLANKTSGYLETKDGIQRYYIEDDKAYLINFGVLNETTLDEKFKTFFDVSYIFDLINGHYPIMLDNVFNYSMDDNYIKIKIGETDIKNIEILWDNNKYYLEFSNIGEILDITY